MLLLVSVATLYCNIRLYIELYYSQNGKYEEKIGRGKQSMSIISLGEEKEWRSLEQRINANTVNSPQIHHNNVGWPTKILTQKM